MILTTHQLADLVVVLHTRGFTKASITDMVTVSGHSAEPDTAIRMEWKPDENRWFFNDDDFTACIIATSHLKDT